MTSVIPFDEIIPGGTVRFAVIDGVQYLSVRDLIMVMCGQNNDRAGYTWRMFPDSVKDELRCFSTNYKFPGRGQQEQPMIQFQGALNLFMQLPGSQAKQFRSKAAEILTRYFAGDKTLLADIYANAESQDVVCQAARAALPNDHKRKAMELEIQEEALQMSRIERHLKTVNMQNKLLEMYTSLCPDNQLDDRTRLHFKDVIVNLSSMASGKAITLDNNDTKSPNAPLKISTIATELGLRFTTDELKCIGAKISKLYRAKYGTAPPKHEQQCGGAVRPVCSYTERDRDIVEQALREYKACV